jgi:hypothetical protein
LFLVSFLSLEKRFFMVRKFFIAAAVLATVAVAAPAFAGGRSSGGGKSAYTVRVKNNGTVSEFVSVTQGASPAVAGGKTLNANQVGQWSVKKGAFVVAASDPAATSTFLGQQAFNAGPAKLIYALAAQDGTVATVTGSTGQRF